MLRAVCHVQKVCKYGLRHAVGAVIGSVAHDNAMSLGGSNIYAVVTCSQDGDKSEFRQLRHFLFADIHFVYDQDIGFVAAFYYLVRLRAFIYGHFAQLLQSVPVQVSRITAICVENYDFHVVSIERVRYYEPKIRIIVCFQRIYALFFAEKVVFWRFSESRYTDILL